MSGQCYLGHNGFNEPVGALSAPLTCLIVANSVPEH